MRRERGRPVGFILLLALTAFWVPSLAGVASAAALWRTLPAPAPLPAATTQSYVAHDGAQLWYATFGKGGPPVILLHGGLADSGYWGNQVPVLVHDGHRVILIDSRGHGRSSRDKRPYTYELMESDVVAVMDALHVDKAAVVGWSDGAIIGLVMALKNPERLTRVFAFAANMDPSGVKADTGRNPTFVRFEREAAAAYKRMSPTPDDYPLFRLAINRMWDTEPNYKAADLARITTPMAIVDGDHDEAIEPDHTRYLARTIPGAQLIILPGVSHFAMLQDPAAFNAAMLGFIDGGR
jgi:pimeloyl-ACP methyl ester carboxylesterase